MNGSYSSGQSQTVPPPRRRLLSFANVGSSILLSPPLFSSFALFNAAAGRHWRQFFRFRSYLRALRFHHRLLHLHLLRRAGPDSAFRRFASSSLFVVVVIVAASSSPRTRFPQTTRASSSTRSAVNLQTEKTSVRVRARVVLMIVVVKRVVVVVVVVVVGTGGGGGGLLEAFCASSSFHRLSSTPVPVGRLYIKGGTTTHCTHTQQQQQQQQHPLSPPFMPQRRELIWR